MLKIGVIIISISVNKCCNHDTIEISSIFKMAAAILDFEKKAIVGAWHHPDLISRGSEDSKTVLTSNTCFFKGVKLGFLRTITQFPCKVKGRVANFPQNSELMQSKKEVSTRKESRPVAPAIVLLTVGVTCLQQPQ